MKRLLLIGALFGAFTGSALAQVNVVPQVGVTTSYLPKTTYSSAFFAFVPVVTAGVDELCIQGSASKIVKLQRLTINSTTTVAAQTLPVQLVRRNSINTGGTAALTTANPGITTQIASRDTGLATNLSATATLVSWTAAPTIVDTAPVFVDSQLMAMPLGLASTQAPGVVDFFYSRDNVNLLGAPTLRGTTQALCINISSAITNASVWNGSIVWTEE